jgi:short-subunit dehydrogenase
MSSAVVVGASAGVGRALAERLARNGYDLVLVARDSRDLEPTANDLSLRFGRRCTFITADIGRADWDITSFLSECQNRIGDIDCLMVPAGAVASDDFGANPEVIAGVIATNFVGPARLAAAFGRGMAERGRGSLVLFSSIAAAAPRRRNAAYSAAKAALEVYAKALRHELEPRGVKVLVIALGYVDTRQSYGMRLLFPIARPESVAEYVAGAAQHSAGKRHFPWFWFWITALLRLLPWSIYRRLSF